MSAQDRVCEGCGDMFQGGRSDKRYCTDACRGRSYAKANAERRREILQRWNERNPERRRGIKAGYRERNRAEIAEKNRGYRKRNGPRLRETLRQRYASNPERQREATRRWRERSPDRVRELANERERRRRALKRETAVGVITLDLIEQKFAYWGNRCYICGGPWSEVEHVKPLSKGGSHMLANLRPVCGPCNRRKFTRWDGPRALFNRRKGEAA